MDRSVRKGDRVIVQFKNEDVEYVIDHIDGTNIYIKPMDGEDLLLIYFNGHNWVVYGREDIKFRFDPPDIIQQIGDPNVMIKILTKLSYPDIVRMCETSKEITQICQSDELWRIKLWEDFKFNIPTDKPLRQMYSEIYDAKRRFTGPPRAAIDATVNGNLEMLKWLNSLNPTIHPNLYADEFTANLAAENGHLHILEWLDSLDPPVHPDVKGADIAAISGNLHVLKWLNNLNPPILPSSEGVDSVPLNGDLDVLKWLNTFNPPIRPGELGANLAAMEGQLEVLEWLSSLNPPILPDIEGANLAAASGHLHVLEWLSSLNPPILPNAGFDG